MIRCIQNNENEVTKATPRNNNLISAETGLSITSPATYDSYLLLAQKTNRFIDIMNGNRDKGCSLIDSPIHPHVFELLEYVKFLTHWKSQIVAANNRYLYFAESTHQDTCWTALSIVLMARKQLPVGFDIVQKRSGTDNLERSFAKSRAKNSGANAQGTDGQMANIGGQMLQNLAGSRKANTGKDSEFVANEIEVSKTKKRTISAVSK